MPKIHTRQKRQLRMRKYDPDKRERTRPKTFKSEKAAKDYAESQGLKNYKLVDLWEQKPDKSKIKIVEE